MDPEPVFFKPTTGESTVIRILPPQRTGLYPQYRFARIAKPKDRNTDVVFLPCEPNCPMCKAGFPSKRRYLLPVVHEGKQAYMDLSPSAYKQVMDLINEKPLVWYKRWWNSVREGFRWLKKYLIFSKSA